MTQGGIKYYSIGDGTKKPVPNMYSSKSDVIDYLKVCMNVPEHTLLQLWNIFDEKKKLVIQYFTELRNHYYAINDRFRGNAYKNAIIALNKTTVPVVSAKQAQKLEGIGSGTAKKLDEIIRTGKLEFVDKKLQEALDKSHILEEFMQITGVGASKAKQFYELGMRSIADVKKNAHRLGLTHEQKVGLEYYDDLLERIPREQIAELKPYLEKLLHNIDPTAKFLLCGSYLRGKPSSGDVDILIGSDDFRVIQKYVNKLEQDGIILDSLHTKGFSKKFFGIAKFPKSNYFPNIARRIDISQVKLDSWWTGVLHCTGSGDFNQKMRAIAKKQGMKLSEDSVTLKSGKVVYPTSEQEIFDLIGMEYVPPNMRN